MEYLHRNLGDYKPKKPEKIKSKQKVLKNAHTKFWGRNMIIYAFKKNVFPLPKEEMSQHKEWVEEEKEKNILLQKKIRNYCWRRKGYKQWIV